MIAKKESEEPIAAHFLEMRESKYYSLEAPNGHKLFFASKHNGRRRFHIITA